MCQRRLLLVSNAFFQGWTYRQISNHLSKAYVVDLEVNHKMNIYDGTMEDVVVVYGSCDDVQSLSSYSAPTVISRTTHQVSAPLGEEVSSAFLSVYLFQLGTDILKP